MLAPAMPLLSRPSLLAVVLATFALAGRGDPPAPGPIEREFPVTTVSALLRPVATQRLGAVTSGKFQLAAAGGTVARDAVIGRFDDQELRTALDTAQLRLRAARQAEADFVADAPSRHAEAAARVADLESRLALAEAVAKNPALLRDLPAAVQDSIAHTDSAGLKAQLEAARAQVARLDLPVTQELSPVHLQALEAERAVRLAESQLKEATITAPFAGTFQPGAALAGATGAVTLTVGQEIGVLRDLSRLVAAVPAVSTYLVRVELARTVLRVAGPGGRMFTAAFREAVTEPSPVLGESRVFLYEFSPADSRELAAMVQTNVDAQVLLEPSAPVAVVAKLDAALKFPEAFRRGWANGVAQAWPGWTLACEGETSLGLVPADHQ